MSDTTRTVSGDEEAKSVFRSGHNYGQVGPIDGSRVSAGRPSTNDLALDEELRQVAFR